MTDSAKRQGPNRKWCAALLLVCLLVFAFLLRVWGFAESGEIDEDEAFFFGMSMMLLDRETIWGWAAVFETDYGSGCLAGSAANYLFLKGMGIPIDERTIQFPGLFWGILGVVGVYLAIREITGDYRVALVVAALVSVIPAQVAQSRSVAGNQVPATCALWWAVYCFARYARLPSKQIAFWAGISLAIYLQTDGMQVVLLAFLPALLWLLGDKQYPLDSVSVFRAGLCFGVLLILSSLIILPAGLGLLIGAARVNHWNPDALMRLKVYATVLACAGITIMLMAAACRFLRHGSALHVLLCRIAHPLLLIPTTLSFAANVAVAWSSFRIFGIPKGVLGHAFAKETAVGFYMVPYFHDILGIFGWPITLLIMVCLGPALRSCRRSPAATALGLWFLLSNLPWLFVAPPSSVGRASYMLTSTTALAAFGAVGLLEICRLVTLSDIGSGGSKPQRGTACCAAVTIVVVILTVPFTAAQVMQKPILGISMPLKNGAYVPSRGVRAAFEYFYRTAQINETVFTDSPHWTARFYLYTKSFRRFPRTAIRALPYMKRREILSYFEKQGKTADWYVVSSAFVEQVGKSNMTGMGLRALIEGPGGSTQVWQRDYTGPVESLRVVGRSS